MFVVVAEENVVMFRILSVYSRLVFVVKQIFVIILNNFHYRDIISCYFPFLLLFSIENEYRLELNINVFSFFLLFFSSTRHFIYNKRRYLFVNLLTNHRRKRRNVRFNSSEKKRRRIEHVPIT